MHVTSGPTIILAVSLAMALPVRSPHSDSGFRLMGRAVTRSTCTVRGLCGSEARSISDQASTCPGGQPLNGSRSRHPRGRMAPTKRGNPIPPLTPLTPHWKSKLLHEKLGRCGLKPVVLCPAKGQAALLPIVSTAAFLISWLSPLPRTIRLSHIFSTRWRSGRTLLHGLSPTRTTRPQLQSRVSFSPLPTLAQRQLVRLQWCRISGALLVTEKPNHRPP